MSAGTSHPGKIQINTGTWTSDCVRENDLIANSAVKPAYRDFLERANRRSLSTLIVSDVITPYGVDNRGATKIPDIATKGKSVGNNGYRFSVMGRIEKASVIIRQIGATTSDGRFTLLMNDAHLYDGMNATFYGSRFVARVEGNPSGSPAAGYVVNFWAPSGDAFSWATHVAGQVGTKTCFPAYTTYGEKSERGYSRSKFADTFINHTSKQRKTCEITGDAMSDILWYTYTADDGSQEKGWMYEQLQQARATFTMEDEHQKWFGVSTMKNSDGSLRVQPPVDNRGEALIAGDGLEEQIAGGTVMSGTGSNGDATIEDLTEMGITLEVGGNKLGGNNKLIITGTRGYANFQSIAVAHGINQNMTFFNNVEKDGRIGGPLVDVGYEFAAVNVNGNRYTICKHPLLDDELRFSEKGADGNILMSSTYFVLEAGMGENKNIEILHKSGNGVNRKNVMASYNGLTGAPEVSISEEDAYKYAMLKEDMIVVYNTQLCGIIRKDS